MLEQKHDTWWTVSIKCTSKFELHIESNYKTFFLTWIQYYYYYTPSMHIFLMESIFVSMVYFFLLLYLYSCSGFSIHCTSLYFSYPQIILNEIHQKIHNFCNKISTFKQIKKLCYPNDYIMYYGLIMDEILVSEIYKHVRLLAV